MNATARWWLRLAALLAIAVGLKYGYEFGDRISGPWVGAVLALNCAVFGSLLVHGIAERLWRRWAGPRGPG